MTPRSRRLLQLGALALLIVLAVGLALALAHRPSGARADLGGRAVSVRQELTPRDPQFGDPVVATIDVFADSSRVDAGTVQVKAAFGPYTVAAGSRGVRLIGGVWVMHVERRLRCLGLACVPPGSTKVVRFTPVRVSYREGSRTHALASPWPPLRIHSRVTEAELARSVLRVPAPVAAPPRYSLSPTATGSVLLALAALLAAAAAALLLRVALRSTVPMRRVPPLERVLRELAAASSNGDSGRRRRALEELARELEPLDLPLSVESRILAWGPGEPQPEAISDLAGRVRTAVRP